MHTKIRITFNDSVLKVYNDDSILNFTCSENMTDAILSVSPGVCEQYAEISFYDRDNFLHERAYAGKTDDAKIECIYVDDSNVEHLLGTYYSSEWEVDGDNTSVKVKCRDKTYIMDTVSIPALTRGDNKSLTQLLTILFQNMHGYNWQFLDSDTETRCNSIIVDNCWFYSSTLKEILNKICYLGMLRIFYHNEIFYVGRCI